MSPQKTMKAVLKADRAPGLRYVDNYPVPEIGHGEVLVRVQAGSVFGTDLHIYNWDEWAQHRFKPPFVGGHEISGEIAPVAPHVDSVTMGDLVVLANHV